MVFRIKEIKVKLSRKLLKITAAVFSITTFVTFSHGVFAQTLTLTAGSPGGGYFKAAAAFAEAAAGAAGLYPSCVRHAPKDV